MLFANRTLTGDSVSRLARRDLLRLAGVFGVSFSLPGLEARAANERGAERKKSLITIWLDGGPSQLETWDPHPGTKIGGPTTAIDTKIPGLQIAHNFPNLAEQIHNLSVVRSLVSKEGDHERGTYLLKTGFRPDPTLRHPSVGAIVSHETADQSIEIPQHVSLGNSQWPARGGYLGDEFDAFKIFDPGRNLHNMRARVGDDRQKRRLANLEVASGAFRQGRTLQTDRTLHQHTVEHAIRMMSSEQLKAFDIDQEPAAVRAAYGDSSFGRGCLVARRLVEQGVRAIEVNLRGFDTHANNFEGNQQNAAILDPAFAALLHDLSERDLLQSTVVLCIGEFGRTPNINPLDGRDHWPSGFSCLVGGGGLQAGKIIGSTDPTGEKKMPSDPVQVADLYSTLLSVFEVDYQRDNPTPIGRPMKFSEGKPLAQLLS
ncbi:MAG: DUF1501 domain-containing protein [Planctomycetaceae bacterium]